MFQVLLPSGRAIRYRELAPSEYDKVMNDAALVVGKDASMMQLVTTGQFMGVKKMLAAITTKSGLSDADVLKPETKWLKPNAAEMDENYDKWFTAKDHLALTAIYRQMNELSIEDVDAIVKKALPVSED